MTLAELGAQLKEERLRLNIALEDAASRLKIATRVLRALESGDESDLPHMVYTKGFIRSYGALLGFVPEEIAALLDSLDGAEPQLQEPRTKLDIPSRHGGRALGFLLKLMLLAALGAGGYYYYVHNYRDAGPETASWENNSLSAWFSSSGDEEKKAEASQAGENLAEAVQEGAPEAGMVVPDLPVERPNATPAPSAMDRTVPQIEPAGNSSPVATPANPLTPATLVNPAGTSPANTEAAATANPASAPAAVTSSLLPGPGLSASTQAALSEGRAAAVEAAAATAPTVSAAEQAAQNNNNPQPQLLPDGQHQVVVTADAECWLHANADGTVTREFSLKKGETFAMPFKKTLVLKLGNAGGVRIKYDGVEQASPGKSGEVKTVRFPPQ